MDNMMNDFSGLMSGSMGTATWIVSAAITIASVIGLWGIFNKAGEHGWAAIVPFYNMYVQYKITWGNGWFFLLLLIPVANVVIEIITMVKLAKAFSKGAGFALGLIFLSFIFKPLLGFGDARYIGVPNKGDSHNE